MEELVLKIDDLVFSYGQHPVINHLDLTVEQNQAVVLRGENGSGKSTLVKLITGQLDAQSGSIQVLGEEVQHMNDYSDLGYVPQVTQFDSISFPVTVEEMIVLMDYPNMGMVKVPKKASLQKAHDQLEKFQLEEYVHTPFNELSGGLQQRAMIARAMMKDPAFLILDEPTAGVDHENKMALFDLLNDMKNDGLTYLMITHELDLVLECLSIDQVYEIKEGALDRVNI